MGDNTKEQKSNAKGLWLKILVPALIVVIVAGIFLLKNPPKASPETSPEEALPEATDLKEPLVADPGAVDFNSSEFALDASEDFDFDAIMAYGLPVLIDFGADSCVPCKKMAPILEELNAELRGKAIVKFVDISKNAQAARSFPIRAIPTQFFFDKDASPYIADEDSRGFISYATEDNEHVLTAHEGFMSKEEILEVFKDMGVE